MERQRLPLKAWLSFPSKIKWASNRGPFNLIIHSCLSIYSENFIHFYTLRIWDLTHVRQGFEFLGYKIKRWKRPLRLSAEKIRSGIIHGQLYAYPRQKSIEHFKEQIRRRTFRRAPVSTMELIAQVNPVIRGWGQYFCKAHVRGLFHRLDGWIVRRLWSHRYKRWRCQGWKTLPTPKLYGEMGLVNLISLIPSLRSGRTPTFVKTGCGKTACPV